MEWVRRPGRSRRATALAALASAAAAAGDVVSDVSYDGQEVETAGARCLGISCCYWLV